MTENNDYFDENSPERNEFIEWFDKTVFNNTMRFLHVKPDVDAIMQHGASSISRDLANKIQLGFVNDIKEWFSLLTDIDKQLLTSIAIDITSQTPSDYAVQGMTVFKEIICLLHMLEDYYMFATSPEEFAVEYHDHFMQLIWMIEITNAGWLDDFEELTFFPARLKEPNADQ